MARTGIVTILFTDLVDSTRLLEEMGDDEAEEVRQKHFQLLRDAVALTGGQEVKNLGDGLMVVFPSALDAVGCAVAMQQAIELYNKDTNVRPLQVRVGLHAGEPIRAENDYFGMAVVVAKRLCDSAQGGQIVASDLVKALVGARGKFKFGGLGSLALKGLSSPLATCEISWRSESELGASREPETAPVSPSSSPPLPESEKATPAKSPQRRFVLLAGGIVLVLGALAAGTIFGILPRINSASQPSIVERPIELGKPSAGALERVGRVDAWKFTASAGQVVDVAVKAVQSSNSTLDPFLEFVGPAGQPLAFSERGGLRGLLLPQNGEYTVKVSSFKGAGTGPYQIELSKGLFENRETLLKLPGRVAFLQPGLTGFGFVKGPGEIDDWKLRASAGQVVNINVKASPSASLDPFLELVSPAGSALASSERGDLSGLLLPEDGAYTVKVRSSKGAGTGLYRIELSYRQ